MDFIINPIQFIADWLETLLLGWGLAEGFVDIILLGLGAFVIANHGMLFLIALIWIERKIAARFQDRVGPNRVGPYGLFQTFADLVKLFTKEDTTPDGADKVIFNLAPILAVFSALMIWAVIPFAETWVGTDLNVGVLYIVAVGAIGIVATLTAGWSSNNKFALLGAFRTVAQLVSYEVPMIISMMIPVLLVGSMGLTDIVDAQSTWYTMLFWLAPIPALIFFVSSVAEVGRTPFDLLEAESEIVAGFHIEYSGAKFAMIFAAEFLHAFTISILTATIFLGGWQGPGAEQYPLLGWFYFMLKSMLVYFVVAWLRVTLPRIRIDHMLDFNWKLLTPLSLALLIVIGFVDRSMVLWFGVDFETTGGLVTRSIVLFAVNILMGWGVIQLMKAQQAKRPGRVPVGEPRPVARPPQSETA